MEISWVEEASEDLENTLDYWYKRNGSYSYPSKIIQAIEQLKIELKNDPYFLAKYSEHLVLYKKTIMKGKFIIYYKIMEDENLVEIRYFRSSKQKPL